MAYRSGGFCYLSFRVLPSERSESKDFASPVLSKFIPAGTKVAFMRVLPIPRLRVQLKNEHLPFPTRNREVSSSFRVGWRACLQAGLGVCLCGYCLSLESLDKLIFPSVQVNSDLAPRSSHRGDGGSSEKCARWGIRGNESPNNCHDGKNVAARQATSCHDGKFVAFFCR